MRIYMQSAPQDGQFPRFYQIHIEPDLLEGWLVVKEWGYQGAAGRVKKDHFKTLENAEQDALLTRDNQIKRGYRVVFVQGDRVPSG